MVIPHGPCRLGCWNKLPQNEWLKTTEMYSHIVLQARSLKFRCWRGQLSLKASLLLPGYWSLPTILGLSKHHPNLCLCSHMAFSLFLLCTPMSQLYKDTSHWIKAHINLKWSHLNLIALAKTVFPNKVKFTGVRTWTFLFGSLQQVVCPQQIILGVQEMAITCNLVSYRGHLQLFGLLF